MDYIFSVIIVVIIIIIIRLKAMSRKLLKAAKSH